VFLALTNDRSRPQISMFKLIIDNYDATKLMLVIALTNYRSRPQISMFKLIIDNYATEKLMLVWAIAQGAKASKGIIPGLTQCKC